MHGVVGLVGRYSKAAQQLGREPEGTRNGTGGSERAVSSRQRAQHSTAQAGGVGALLELQSSNDQGPPKGAPACRPCLRRVGRRGKGPLPASAAAFRRRGQLGPAKSKQGQQG